MHSWQPTASIENLKQRAAIIRKIREFFAARNVMEVETPLLSNGTVTDIHLQSFATEYKDDAGKLNKTLYLQTSPEFAMKRLLAAGAGSIYQICKAFRNHGESGRMHNPEFTVLEWYRLDFNHHDLMREIDELLQIVLTSKPAQYFTYAELFEEYCDLNPHTISLDDLIIKTRKLISIPETENNKDNLLNLLMTHIIEPNLGKNNQPAFVYDFPASQAALAKIRNDDPPVAERFELYINGVELANGFHELTNAQEQRARFTKDLAQRKDLNYPAVPMDENLLSALEHGLPNCAGVALGIDRLIMLATQSEKISDVISFPITNA